MARSSPSSKVVKRVVALSERLYALLLYAYPASFRRDYGLHMAHAFRDSCRDTLEHHGLTSLISFWLRIFLDLFINVCLEQWHTLKERVGSMVASKRTSDAPLRLWIALITTIIAFAISLIASFNLYLLEDANRLTEAAYSLSPLLRFSYDGIYISALSAGVAVCAVIAYALVRRDSLVTIGLGVITLIVALGGFGGLLIRHLENFLGFFAVFITLTLLSFLTGRAVAAHISSRLGRRHASVLGACVSVSTVLLVNGVGLVLHTITLNPVSHMLYMQGQIEGTHLNFSLIAMGLAILTVIVCVLSLTRVLYLSLRQTA